MRIIATVVTACAVLAQTTPASATELIVLSIDDVRYGQPGDVVEVASAQVPADLVGRECRVIGRASNQESVHPGNDLLIISGDEVVEVTDFEGGEFAVSEVGEIETLPAEIRVLLRFGVDGVSSGGFTVLVECEDPPPPTAPPTTAPPTTAPPTTAPPVTAPPTTAPSTTAPPTTAPTTTGPSTTTPATTETVAPTTATVASSSSTVSIFPPETTASTAVSATSLGDTNTSTTAPPPAGPEITGVPSSNSEPTGTKLPITGNALTSAVFGFSLLAAGRALHQVSRRLSES